MLQCILLMLLFRARISTFSQLRKEMIYITSGYKQEMTKTTQRILQLSSVPNVVYGNHEIAKFMDFVINSKNTSLFCRASVVQNLHTEQ